MTKMTRPAPDTASASVFAPGPLVLAALIFVAALSRLLPHPPNFSPVEAIALFGGAYFASRAWALAVPLLAMLASDLVLVSIMGGSYATYLGGISFWTVYACIALSTVLGFGLRGRTSAPRVLAYSLAGSVLFFAVTNFGAWLGWPAFYPRNAAGLAAAYVAGIPFFKWTVAGTLAYSAFLFGGFALLRRRLPVLRAQTV
ncbi:MAG: hypothetical protein M3Y70_09025 [Pseudomonadota bacterium]|nr:hypothetical protein [Pseudomonadota bacterium]